MDNLTSVKAISDRIMQIGGAEPLVPEAAAGASATGLCRVSARLWLRFIRRLAAARSHCAVQSSAGGVLGPVFGIVSMSCCAPQLAPALLSFVGFSGTTLLNVNATLRELSTLLTLVSIAPLLESIVLVSRTVTAVCPLRTPRRTTGHSAH